MGILSPGHWPSTHWPANHWVDDHWPDYGYVAPTETPACRTVTIPSDGTSGGGLYPSSKLIPHAGLYPGTTFPPSKRTAIILAEDRTIEITCPT